VSQESVENSLIANQITAVVITSPTYDGAVSDVAAIAAITHRHGARLIVDAAHGAHLGFSPEFPQSPVTQGADVVVMSLHKTLPALTQCALLHVCGDLDAREVAEKLAVFETSSPSYPLLASIDQCLRLLDERGGELFGAYSRRLMGFYGALKPLSAMEIVGSVSDKNRDAGKLVISTRRAGISGSQLVATLRTGYGIELEMSGITHVLGMTSVCDGDDALLRFADALLQIDARLTPRAPRSLPELPLPQRAASVEDALKNDGIAVELTDSVGLISREYVWAYPPGSPLLIPGERVGREFVEYVQALSRSGLGVKSTRGELPGQIFCI
jgi:arginine/lysine/ornithine decarboxylase